MQKDSEILELKEDVAVKVAWINQQDSKIKGK